MDDVVLIINSLILKIYSISTDSVSLKAKPNVAGIKSYWSSSNHPTWRLDKKPRQI